MNLRRLFPRGLGLAFAAALALAPLSIVSAAETAKAPEKKEAAKKGDAKKDWELLGTRNVTDKIDRDTIPVTAKEGKITKLQVRVLGHAVQFRSMTIHFGNDETHEVQFAPLMKAGSASKPIDVPGAERIVKSVEFTYDAQTIGDKGATIKLFGKD
jgi:hypothetical protein